MQVFILLLEFSLITRSLPLPSILDQTNPAFISVYVTNISFDSKMLLVNFSSVLTVDLLELNKQNIKNITCRGLSDKDTQQVDVSYYFTPNITASYQSGILNKVEVHFVS